MEPEPGEPMLDTPELVRELRWSYVGALVQNYRWDRARAVLDALEREAEGGGHRMEVAQWRAREEQARASAAAAAQLRAQAEGADKLRP